MKSKLMFFLIATFCSYNTYADDKTGPYVGIKGGQFQIDINANDSIEDPSALGFVAGFKFNRFIGLEFERNETDDADVKGIYSYIDKLSITTTALYFVFRTPGDVYFKVKSGILREEVDTSCAFCFSGDFSEDDTGLSLGIGLGFMPTKSISLEAEYTLIEEDVGYLSAGVNFHF